MGGRREVTEIWSSSRIDAPEDATAASEDKTSYTRNKETSYTPQKRLTHLHTIKRGKSSKSNVASLAGSTSVVEARRR